MGKLIMFCLPLSLTTGSWRRFYFEAGITV